MADNQSSKDRLREITAGIEEGIKQLFDSEKYAQYLQTMSRFHRYSVNNVMLIHSQKPNATRVAGFNKWRDDFGRHVKRGEKGIQIIAPIFYKKKIEEMKRDPDTDAPILDKDGKAIFEEKEVKVPMFKVVSVFDVSQTEGRPLPELAANLTGDVKQFEIFMEALRRSAPVPIEFKPMDENMDGYFNEAAQNIAIREGMSEVQTVSAAIHEIAHSKLHNYEKAQAEAVAGDENAEQPVKKDRRTEEVEAESISYTVCQYYGIETGENSFGYIASWSKDKELKELRASLETINKTSAELIDDVDRNFRQICKERGIDLSADKEAEAPAQEPEKEAPAAAQEAPAEQPAPAEPKQVFKIEVNPVSNDENDRFFVQQYEENPNKTLNIGAVLFIGSFDKCREVAEGLDKGEITPEQARGMMEAPEKSAPAPEQDTDQEKLYVLDDKLYLHVQTTEDGFDYTMYDVESMKQLDGGQLDEPDIAIHTACLKICEMHGVGEESIKYAPLEKIEELQEAAQKAMEAEAAQVTEAETLPTTPEETISVPMPDPTLSTEDMERYGYTDADMLPLSKDRAMELAAQDITVYLLYGDNTEAMALDGEEILYHEGLCGITREDWEEVMDTVPARDIEKRFQDNPKDAFVIYQLTDDAPRETHFAGLDELKVAPARENYEAVYTRDLVPDDNPSRILDNLFAEFNVQRPDDFTGHSLSVSDIVALKQDGNITYHFCDSFGFKELPDFQKPENALKNAEMAMEDDYGMIDGIINNGEKKPTVAELEHQAMTGTPISLMDLAEAVHREEKAGKARTGEKPSILAKLKAAKQEQQEKKDAPHRSAEREM